MQLPIVFKGKESLENQQLLLNIVKPEISAFGKAVLMPDMVVIDVTDKVLGDTLTIKDFDLNQDIKIMDAEDEIYATITHMRELEVEEPVESEATTEPVVEPTEK